MDAIDQLDEVVRMPPRSSTPVMLLSMPYYDAFCLLLRAMRQIMPTLVLDPPGAHTGAIASWHDVGRAMVALRDFTLEDPDARR
jgi:hypothetical protein